MAMPLSGCIALRTCIIGCACSSIACAVNGSAVGSCSLSALSVAAGKTAPHCMREFYGYSPVSNISVGVSIYWYGDTSYNSGFDGTFRLRGPGGVISATCSVNCSKSAVWTWIVTQNTYCVDFSSIVFVDNGFLLAKNQCWYSDTSSGSGDYTNTFNDNENIWYEGYPFF